MQKPIIKDTNTHKVQLFLSSHLQLGDVLQQILQFTGPAELTVSTFSTGEEFLRRLHILRRKGLVTRAALYCDHKAAEKTARIYPMLVTVYEEVHFVANHSKVMIVEGVSHVVLVMTSQNQTRGNRLENYSVLALPDDAFRIKRQLQLLITYTPPWIKI